MSVLGNVLASTLAALAALLCIANVGAFVVSLRNARRGDPHHVSMVYLIAQILVLFAFLAGRLAEERWIPGEVLLGVALADVSLWCLLALPILLLGRRGR